MTSRSNLNSGSSPFHSTISLYCRSRDGRLLSAEGREAKAVAIHWPTISEQLQSSEPNSAPLPSGLVIETRNFFLATNDAIESVFQQSTILRAREVYHDADKYYIGLLSYQSQGDEDTSFRDWIETLFVLRTTLRPQPYQEWKFSDRLDCGSGSVWKMFWSWVTSPKTTLDLKHKSSMYRKYEAYEATAENIAVLFERMLRNTGPKDQWDRTGRDYFRRRVIEFVSRNEACQMVLPAFPCKSPNSNKVGGSKPDMAERIALETLHDFVQSVEKVHPPGATIWIVHDGHLLSSCIGVDDATVSEYESNIQELYRSHFSSPQDRKRIRFTSLSDLVFPNRNDDMKESLDDAWLCDSEVLYHPLPAELCQSTELVRKLVMASCGIDRAHLRKLIQAQDSTTISTYRGLSRFMLQDLAATVGNEQRSMSQRKKIATTVAAEMMARNQAYSNLIELLFPDFVRLSIHAHDNQGPKFGVRLFPKNKVRAIDDLDVRHEPVPLYNFQIPTPWHNCIVKVAGDDVLYLAKASVARQAIGNGRYTGTWVDEKHCGEEGSGHFSLYEVVMSSECSRYYSEAGRDHGSNYRQIDVVRVHDVDAISEDAAGKRGETSIPEKEAGILVVAIKKLVNICRYALGKSR
ncbi:Pyoverdine/dityrosine biosynthesis protein-domain-containing protein [Nemania sp. FL0031]|nr:Pyoverdine/dityrosine biosynthesis protein-domain-containing protein [Nemania sp. FL0031]